MYAVALAFVTAGTVVPFLTVENKKGQIVDARHKLSSISLFFGGCISLLALVIAVTLPLYAKLIVPGFTEDQVDAFISVTRLMLIQPILLGLTSLISCFAQLKNHFVLYGIAPLGYSLGIISGIVYLYPIYGLHGLTYGVIIGATLSLCVQVFSLRHAKMGQVFPYFSCNDIREIIKLGLPRTGVNVLTQLRVIFFTAFATTLGPGVLSSYLFAQRVTDAVTQVIQQSITTASLPILSKEFVENRFKEYAHVVKMYVLMLGGIGCISAVSLYVAKDTVIEVLYGTSSANVLISFFLVGFLIILPFQMMTGYISISLYSAKDTKSVLYSNMISTLLAVVTCYFTKDLGNISLVYGIIVMAVSNCVVISLLYSRKKLK